MLQWIISYVLSLRTFENAFSVEIVFDKFSIFSINNRMEDLESLIEDEIFYAVYYITLEKIRTLPR